MSQKMKLIGSLTSPFVRKVRIVAAEKFIEYEFEVDVPWNEGTHVPDYNPLGKVPVWVMVECSPRRGVRLAPRRARCPPPAPSA